MTVGEGVALAVLPGLAAGDEVAGGVEAVLAEGLQHHLFLGPVLGKVRS